MTIVIIFSMVIIFIVTIKKDKLLCDMSTVSIHKIWRPEERILSEESHNKNDNYDRY